MTDQVRDFLAQRGYADFVVEGGLPWLVTMWEDVVASVVRCEQQYEDDYLNDMDGRRILAEALVVAPAKERQRWELRVQAADDEVRSRLIPTAGCLCGEENALKYGYTRERNWWYFHRPPVVDSSWRTF